MFTLIVEELTDGSWQEVERLRVRGYEKRAQAEIVFEDKYRAADENVRLRVENQRGCEVQSYQLNGYDPEAFYGVFGLRGA